MSCPATITMNNVSGCYTINKSFSDDMENAMSIRGVGWALRKAMKIAPPITLTFKHDMAASPPNWTLCFPRMGPNSAHDEVQRLDFEWNERKNPAIGTSNARAKTVDVKSVPEAYLKGGEWCDAEIVYEEEINEKEGWNARTAYGFMTVDGKRMFCRKVELKGKKGEVDNSRIVYDYKPIA